MRNRLLICIAAAALVAGGNLAHAQATNPATTDKPAARAGATGTQREAVFPYIGAPNANPSNVPGGNPPP